LLLIYDHFHNVDSTNPKAWKVFPSSDVFLYLSLQWFMVFIKKVLVSFLNLLQGTLVVLKLL
jgi:hypothetical protein